MCCEEGEEALITSAPPIFSTRNPSRGRRDSEVNSGDRVAGWGGEVTVIIAKLTGGPDGCGGWAIYIRQGGASQKEALPYHRRQRLLEGILTGQQGHENLEVLAGDSCPP